MAQSKPKKPVQYPKKFRMKLERMAAEREQRESPDGSSDFERIINTLCHELLLPGSVHLMLSSVDEVNRRLTTTYHLSPPAAFEYLAVWPPWLPETQASS